MTKQSTLKRLLGQAIKVIDDWDLINGAQDEGSFEDLMNLLIVGSHAAGMDPNELQSLQHLLQDGKYKISVKDAD